MFLSLFFIIFLTFYCHISVNSISSYPIVLIVSYDGFRYNYLDSKAVNPVLNNLKYEGTYAEYLHNVFITKTFPNHHSIATGLYPESHGILENTVFDPMYGHELKYSYEFWHYSDNMLPIWIANEKKGHGRYSGIMMWPGNEYNYSGIFPTYQMPWQKNITWEKRVDGVIDWILDPVKPANLVLLYIEEPDSHGHSYGPESAEHLEELKAMDKITKYLIEKLNQTGLSNSVNVFFLSDHGMQSVTKKDIIDLRQFVSDDKYNRFGTSPVFQIYPKDGQTNIVYNALKKASMDGFPFKVYKRDEIPNRWHYKNNRRTPPILAVADVPHVFHDFYENIKYEEKVRNFTAKDNDTFGVHGYDNEEMNMKPYFFAIGPHVKKNYKIEPFETVDLFSLWANMLGFPEYAHSTNGSLQRVSAILESKNKLQSSEVGNVRGALFGIFLIVISVGISLSFVYRKWQLQDETFFKRCRFSEENAELKKRLLENVETEDEA